MNRGRTAKKVRRRWLKKVVSFFSWKNRGDTLSCRPGWLTPTLVTPLIIDARGLRWISGIRRECSKMWCIISGCWCFVQEQLTASTSPHKVDKVPSPTSDNEGTLYLCACSTKLFMYGHGRVTFLLCEVIAHCGCSYSTRCWKSCSQTARRIWCELSLSVWYENRL